MKFHHTLICFFVVTALQAGNTGVLAAGHRIVRGTERETITFTCSFMSSGERKFFCKQECKGGILIETTGNRGQNSRYKVEYSKTFFLSYPLLYVTIAQLAKSDSGWYRCGLGTPLFPDSHEDLEIIVTDAPDASKTNWSLSSGSGAFTPSSASPKTTEQSGRQRTERATTPIDSALAASKPNWTLRPFPTSGPSASTPTTTQRLSSGSGAFTPPSASPKTTDQSGRQHNEQGRAPLHSGKLLYAAVIVVFMIFLLSLAVMLYKRRTKAKVHTHAKYTKPNGSETNDDCSFAHPNCATAATSQHQVNFPSGTTSLLNRAPAGNSNDVDYSVL